MYQVFEVGLQYTEEIVYFREVLHLLQAVYVRARAIAAAIISLNIVLGHEVRRL